MGDYKLPLTAEQRHTLNAAYVVRYKALRQEIMFERLAELIKEHTAPFVGARLRQRQTQDAVNTALRQWVANHDVCEFANRDVFWVKFVERCPGEYGCVYSPELQQLATGTWKGEARPPRGLDALRADAYLVAWGNGKIAL